MTVLKLEIATAERLVYAEDVSIVVAPGADGELAILPEHTSLLTTLKPGELRVVKDGKESLIAVSGGFMEVLSNRVTILADTAERSEEIDEERASIALKRAQEQMTQASSQMELEKAMAAMRRSQARVAVARRKRRTNSAAN
ncbi:MAG: F0F1 ATP synthase subunit epsilon [SAR202 cluster bacterium]|nr:F0F1 ATP synthase subunit epsilon [SAR202 cluster bacterium]